MKRKFFSVVFALVLVLSLSMIMAPPALAASSVSSVWVEFAAGGNTTSNAALYTIHFTTGSALSRGVDTITVIFPDGTTAMGTYAFDLSGASTSAAHYSVDPDGAGTTYGYTTCTSSATIAGYRLKVTTPVDIPASTAATLKILAAATINTAGTAGNSFMVKLATSQDTSFVLSSAFPVDNTVLSAFISTTNYPSALVAGAASAYKFDFTPATEVPIGGTVTVEFPVGTYLPDTIATTNVYAGNGSDDPTASAVSVNTAARTVTVTTAEALTVASMDLYFLTGAGIKNKTTLGHLAVHMWTSTDGQKFAQTDTDDIIVSGTATTLEFVNRAVITTYSDDATILYTYTDALIIRSVDAYGNLKDVGTTEPTVALSVTTGSGAFYTDQAGTLYTNTALSGGSLSSDAIYYRPTSAGTHTLQAATVGSPSLTSATWTVYVAPAVVLKDASNNTIGSYGPAITATSSRTYGGAWVQAAIDAAFPGDTVELGDGIYELSTVLTLDEKITLTEASGASATLRPTGEMDRAIIVTGDGTSTYPVIIDGLTFTRLRSASEFDCAIYNNGYDYMTVRNCTFSRVIPDENTQHEAVIWVRTYVGAIASCTISSNTFTNCGPFDLAVTGRAGVIVCLTTDGAGTFTGLTISGNEMTNCYEHGIELKGSSSYKIVASITNNTFTSGLSCINLSDTAGSTPFGSVSITGNTFTDAYSYVLKVESGNGGVTVKNNTITGTAGTYAVTLEEPAQGTHYCWFNDFTGNNGYAIRGDAATNAQDCKYNWYGSATGPAYTAVTGATVTTSNPSGTGDSITDKVTYYPWLHVSKATVVADDANYCAQRVNLSVGLNTLSTPALLITTANTIAELIPDYATNMEYCYKFDNGIWSNIGSDTLTPCHGYYIKMTVADSVLLKYDADEYYTPQWLLDEEWNLISLANLESKRVDLATTSVLLDSAGLPGYSQVISPSMNASSWTYSVGGTATNKNMLVGEAYWIYMQNDATLAGFTIFPLVPDLT